MPMIRCVRALAGLALLALLSLTTPVLAQDPAAPSPGGDSLPGEQLPPEETVPDEPAAPAPPAEAPKAEDQPVTQGAAVTVLQALDKVTGRITTIEVPPDGTVRFGSLAITSRACREKPVEEAPESAAFLEIAEIQPDQRPVPIFSGWMFASSPALSSLEHPVYDVWVIDCRMAAPGSP
ncbi:DUF2155 domain-containing protein [Zavarzinia sp. CC-PAN008]|uniref:DUF2155 domain-containing protein n=1 Tax=Zavarzinia sp. CC-PAN008 TaxID=3243332 RepID=UPI003F743B67